MEYRELNEHIVTFMANADICAVKLKEWYKRGTNILLLDLRRAYLQICIDESLWPYKTVVFKGPRYYLIQLGLGVNVAPLIIRSIVDTAMSKDQTIKSTTSTYVDDICVNENLPSTAHVRKLLSDYRFVCKDPKRLQDGAKALSLQVWGENATLRWKWGSEVPNVPHVVTHQNIFSLCGKLVGHFPVFGWIRVAAGFIKHRINAISNSWDAMLTDSPLGMMVWERVKGEWCTTSREMDLWVDTSSLAMRVSLKDNGTVIKDAYWLYLDNNS